MDATARAISGTSATNAPRHSWSPREAAGRHVPADGESRNGLKLLLEGNSVSSVERVTGVHHGRSWKLLVLAGEKCERIMAEKSQRPGARRGS